MRSRIGLLLLFLAVTAPFGGGVCFLWAATDGVVIDVGFDGGRQAAAVEPVLVESRGRVDMFSLLAAPNGKGAFHSRGPWLVATYARTEMKFDAFKPFAPTWSTGYLLQSRDPIPRYDIAWDDKGGRLVFVAERPLGGTRGLAMASFVWPAAGQDAAPETYLEIDPLKEHKKRFPADVISDFWIPTVLINGATGEYVLAGGGEGSRVWSATSSTGGRTWEHGNVVGRGRAPVVVRSNELLLFWKRILRGNPDEMGAIPEPLTPLYISWGGNSGEWRDGRRIEVAGDRVGLFDACTMGTQSVFVAYVQRQSNTDSVWAVVSPDCGRTWRTPVFVADHVLPESRPSILALEDGTVLVAFSRFADGRPIVSYTVLAQTNLMARGEGPVKTEGSYARRSDAALAVVSILGDEDPEVRLRSVELLRRLQCETESVIRSLADALGDESPKVRLAAEAALKEIGGAARSVLLEAMQVPVGTEKKAAATRLFGMLAAGSDVDLLVAALGDIGFASPEVVKGLCSALRDKESSVRSEAVQALEELGGKAKTAVPDLIETMRTDKNLRYLARTAIEEIGDAQSVKMVRDALTNEKNEEVRTILAGLIKSLDDRSKED